MNWIREAAYAVVLGLACTIAPAVPALQSDGVDANEVPFLSTFPYLADPHTS
ncbi:MAG: hypothetical protein V3S91_06815 [Gemmatimonadota bacterium]|jgi:hypothetical protein